MAKKVSKKAKAFLKEVNKTFRNSLPLRQAFLKIDFMDKDCIYDVKDEIWKEIIEAVGAVGLDDPYQTYHEQAAQD